jgi:hypothetical protein
MLNSGLFHATGAFATLQTINRGSTVQAWLEAAARHNARVQSLESSYGSYGLSAAPMLRSFSLLGKTSYLPLAEDSWLSEIRIGPLNKAENHNGNGCLCNSSNHQPRLNCPSMAGGCHSNFILNNATIHV